VSIKILLLHKYAHSFQLADLAASSCMLLDSEQSPLFADASTHRRVCLSARADTAITVRAIYDSVDTQAAALYNGPAWTFDFRTYAIA
jgi:hypothetical protein